MVYAFSPLFVWGAVGLAILAAAIGAFLVYRKKSMGNIFVAFAMAAVLGGLVAPALASDRVVIDDEKIVQTTGFWTGKIEKGFRFADVDSITVEDELDEDLKPVTIWYVELKNGDTLEIDTGDLWDMNEDDIIARLRAKGLSVSKE